MFQPTTVFNSFSVNDLAAAKSFYTGKLGIKITEQEEMGFKLHLPGCSTYVYPKPDHEPATFTILNFKVHDIDAAMEDLKKKRVEFLFYDRSDLPQDENGVFRGRRAGMGPDIAWFMDPAGNVLSILQED